MRLAYVLLLTFIVGCTACEKRASQSIKIHQPGLGFPTVDISFDFEQKWVDKEEK